MAPLTFALAAVVALAVSSPQTDGRDAGAAVAAAPGRVDVSPTPDLTIIGAGADDRVALEEAEGMFRAAGLDLPDLEVAFSDDEADCQGHPGLFEQRRQPWRISVCSDLAYVIPHELAHAWAAANLDDADRADYIAARGLTNWSDHDAPWDERGTEDAAFIVQQNLTSEPPRAYSPTWAERIDAYELLTGRPSPLLAERLGD